MLNADAIRRTKPRSKDRCGCTPAPRQCRQASKSRIEDHLPNSYRHYIFKEDLQKLSDKIGIEIRVAHYPPYASKWNPLEHRLFPHITRSLKGVILKSHEIVKELIGKTETKTGLQVKANIINKVYETGRKCSEGFKETMRIVFDDVLPQWNYTAVPSSI